MSPASATPVKPATLKIIDATRRRLGEVLHVPLRELRSGEVLDVFDRRAKETLTAAEQPLRYANVANRVRNASH